VREGGNTSVRCEEETRSRGPAEVGRTRMMIPLVRGSKEAETSDNEEKRKKKQ
jgi:hypothetical protein